GPRSSMASYRMSWEPVGGVTLTRSGWSAGTPNAASVSVPNRMLLPSGHGAMNGAPGPRKSVLSNSTVPFGATMRSPSRNDMYFWFARVFRSSRKRTPLSLFAQRNATDWMRTPAVALSAQNGPGQRESEFEPI